MRPPSIWAQHPDSLSLPVACCWGCNRWREPLEFCAIGTPGEHRHEPYYTSITEHLSHMSYTCLFFYNEKVLGSVEVSIRASLYAARVNNAL